MLLSTKGLLESRRSRSQYGPLHECVVGDGCHPSWVDTAGPGVTWEVPVDDPDATIEVTTRVVFGGFLVATPGDKITPEQATLWGVPS